MDEKNIDATPEELVGDEAQEATSGTDGKKKPGPKPKADGFRAECYKKIEKGIDRNTEMIVVKMRHRLGDGKNLFVGDKFIAKDMDARVICSAMERYWIMPAYDMPEDGERGMDWIKRMMKKYEPDKAPSDCVKNRRA